MIHCLEIRPLAVCDRAPDMLIHISLNYFSSRLYSLLDIQNIPTAVFKLGASVKTILNV